MVWYNVIFVFLLCRLQHIIPYFFAYAWGHFCSAVVYNILLTDCSSSLWVVCSNHFNWFSSMLLVNDYSCFLMFSFLILTHPFSYPFTAFNYLISSFCVVTITLVSVSGLIPNFHTSILIYKAFSKLSSLSSLFFLYYVERNHYSFVYLKVICAFSLSRV